MESVLGVIIDATSESIGAVVSGSPSGSSVPPSIPSSFEDELLQHTKKMLRKV